MTTLSPPVLRLFLPVAAGFALAWAAVYALDSGKPAIAVAILAGTGAAAAAGSLRAGMRQDGRALWDRLACSGHAIGVCAGACLFLLALFGDLAALVAPTVLLVLGLALPFMAAISVRTARNGVGWGLDGSSVAGLLKSIGVIAGVGVGAWLVDAGMGRIMDPAYAALGTCVILAALLSIAEERFLR